MVFKKKKPLKKKEIEEEMEEDFEDEDEDEDEEDELPPLPKLKDSKFEQQQIRKDVLEKEPEEPQVTINDVLLNHEQRLKEIEAAFFRLRHL